MYVYVYVQCTHVQCVCEYVLVQFKDGKMCMYMLHVHALVFQNVLSHMAVYSHWNIAMSSTSHSSCNPEQLKLNHCVV